MTTKSAVNKIWKTSPWPIKALLVLLALIIGVWSVSGDLVGDKGVDASVAGQMIQNTDEYLVTKVVDGDTIKVDIEGEAVTIRMIGLDTPETVAPNKPVECFGKEASDYLKSLLTDKYVRLQDDPTQDNADRYGRLLRYVYLNNTNINLQMIAAGYGHEYTYKVPYQFQAEFQQAETNARLKGLGLWGSICTDQ